MNKEEVIELVAVTCLIGAFLAGRYTAPTKTLITEKTQTSAQISAQSATLSDADTQTETTVTTIEKPTGEKETVTHITKDTEAASKRVAESVASSQTSTESTKTIENAAGKVTLSALAGYSIHDLGSPVYGGSVSKQILGPISVGVWGLSTGVFGVSVGVSL